MPFLVGTDEAGYGPNFGPLVISATVWRVESMRELDLYARLHDVVSSSSKGIPHGKLAIGDSKELYKPGKGLECLERGVLTCLAVVRNRPRSWRSIWDLLRADEAGSIAELPWYRDFDEALPIDADLTSINDHAHSLSELCERVRCVLHHVESRAVFPGRFNALVEQNGNKATTLSQVTLQLVKSVLEHVPDEDAVYILCDKHGGRQRYSALLNHTFPEALAVVQSESRQESVYVIGQGARRREFVFCAKGERFLPSALASMVSKYLRELAMRAFNHFWMGHIEDLKPTAGYPLDARRYKAQITPTQRKLGIDDRILWRLR